jgi:hypothetical protein
MREAFDKARFRAASENSMDQDCRDPEADRTKAAAEPNETGPDQGDLKLGRSESLLKPDPELQPSESP